MPSLCIYCRKPTDGDATRAHIFPEALGNKDLLLPPGTVCAKCNHYAGHELESATVAHPSIAMALHYLGAHAKKGRVRNPLATILHEPPHPPTRQLTSP